MDCNECRITRIIIKTRARTREIDTHNKLTNEISWDVEKIEWVNEKANAERKKAKVCFYHHHHLYLDPFFFLSIPGRSRTAPTATASRSAERLPIGSPTERTA